jgi:predicted nicotinamide N-methyase
MGWSFSLEPHTVSDDIPLSISSRFDTLIREYRVGTHLFRILTVRDPVTLLDAVTPATFAADERLPYWAELWTSALVLAEQCLVSPAIGGKRVLDLGCGLGLTGIAAAAQGAEVLFTDYEEDALAFAEWNARTNLTADAFERSSFRIADWRTPGQYGSFDVVLGADIVYERRNFEPLLACLDATISDAGEAWLAEPDRSMGYDFLTLARERGWVATTQMHMKERRGRTTAVRLAHMHRERA